MVELPYFGYSQILILVFMADNTDLGVTIFLLPQFYL